LGFSTDTPPDEPTQPPAAPSQAAFWRLRSAGESVKYSSPKTFCQSATASSI
jgi:hypothetical protein